MKKVELKGIITPILTPMNEDESVNTPELRNQIERLIEGGVHGIFPFGTNGEGYILSEKEKEEVLEATIDQVKGRVPVYAGSGCISTADTIRMSKKAQQLGADVLSIITPSFAVASQKELYDHYVEVAKHVDTPIVLYNIPARTGNKLLPETVAKLAKDVDVIVGAKDSSGDWENLKAYIHQTQELDKDFYVLSGNDSLILPSLKEGGFGGIAGCSNVYPHVLSSIYNLFKEGKIAEAEAAQDSIASFRAVFKYGNPNTVVKTAVKMLGYPVGGGRRDEEKSRAKERIFSFRNENHAWDPKNQRPEMWKLYNSRIKKGQEVRVFPLSNWTEKDIWQYIKRENIEIPSLYFAKERPVVYRDGNIIMVDDDRMKLRPGEKIQMKSVRFRTLGCYPLTGGVESTADTLDEIIDETLSAVSSERTTRVIDNEAAGSMERRKREGYF